MLIKMFLKYASRETYAYNIVANVPYYLCGCRVCGLLMDAWTRVPHMSAQLGWTGKVI